MKIAKDNGATTIAITGPGRSPLIKMADIKISSQYEELDDYLLTSYARLSQIIIMDILYTGVAEENYEKLGTVDTEDFEQCGGYTSSLILWV